MTAKANFSGYATKSNLKCSDGRTIMDGAFKHQHQMKVPLVWQHQHNDPDNILGYAILEHREGGVYTYGYFNESPAGMKAKIAVEHGDVEALSIYANKLQEANKVVSHGDIKEVSLVLSGANPGALIDNVYISHGDSVTALEGEAIIYTDESITLEHSDDEDEDEDEELDVKEVLESLDEDQQVVVENLLHSALTSTESEWTDETIQEIFHSLTEDQQIVVHAMIGEALEHASNQGDEMTDIQHAEEKTVKDVFDSMSEEQKNVVYFMIGEALDGSEGGDAKHADTTEYIAHALQEGFESMSRNAFENNGGTKSAERTLSHSEFETILADAKSKGSFAESFLEHTQNYGIENIDVLFPDAQSLTNSPDVIGRRTEWVNDVINGARHSPFARIKSAAVDLTADEARAKGYVKGNLKKDEVIKLLKRVTTPTTVYKKQKLDRDDIVDITDLDVVAWLKAEMRLMLDEEIARAILIGDGRESDDEDKIDEDHIRPIAYDVDMYTHSITVASAIGPDAIIESVLRARTFYKGTGTPNFYTTDAILTDLILLKDKVGRRLYETEAALAAAMRVGKIVTVEVMESTPDLLGVVVNMADYTIGADKGGQIAMFDDFDIDYNQQKYLIETRISGCLTKPKSAIAIKRTQGTTVTPQTPSFNGATNTITFPTVAGVTYSVEGVTKTGDLVIEETTDVEARPQVGYSFPHNTDADWTFVYSGA
jgi:Phage capsid family./Caudovirus prohead protease.